MVYNNNYGFNYPGGEDTYNVEDFNENFSETCDEMDAIYDSIDTVENTLGNKASATHKHSANDITSGVLPVTRGGTGANTAEDARNNMGLKAAAVCGVTDNCENNNSNLITSKGVYNAVNNHRYSLGSTNIEGTLPLSKMNRGNDGYILQAKGGSTDPIWADPESINIGSADVTQYIKGLDATNWNCDELWNNAAFYDANGTNKVKSDYAFIRRMNTENNGSIAFVDKKGEASAGGNSLNIIIDGDFYQNSNRKVLDVTATAPSGGNIYPVDKIVTSEPSSVAKGKVVYVVE